MALDFISVQKAEPQEKAYWLPGSDNGIRCKVNPNGRKYFIARKVIDGKRREIHLGAFDPTKVSKERMLEDIHKKVGEPRFGPVQAARKLQLKLDDIAAGNDCSKKDKQNPLFEKIAYEWIDAKSKGWGSKQRQKQEGMLRNHCAPILQKGIDDISSPDIVSILQTVHDLGSTSVRELVFALIKKVYRYAKARGYTEATPAEIDVDALFDPHQAKPFASLDFKHIEEFWYDIDNWEGSEAQSESGGQRGLNPLSRLAIKLQVLTVVRPGELRVAHWEEFDLDGKEHEFPTWRIPVNRMKSRKHNPKDHIVPLSVQAVRVLRDLHKISGHLDRLFPGIPGKGTKLDPYNYMSDGTVNNACKRMGYAITAHGFRHMASTALNEAYRSVKVVTADGEEEEIVRRFHEDWIEKALAHTDSNKTRGTYNQAEYLEQRWKMLQWYADQFLPRPGGGSIKAEQLIPPRSLKLVA